MNKWRFLNLLMINFCFVVFSFFSTLLAAEMTNEDKIRLEKIEVEIDSIQKEIHENSLKSMEAEVNTEKFMKYEWDKYVNEVQIAEKFDKKIGELNEQLKTLKAERALIIQKATHVENKL